MKNLDAFNRLVNHLKVTGFFFPSSQIYGGLANSFDLAPLGVLLANNIKNLWIKHFVTSQENSVLFDSKILQHPKVWEASQHVSRFCDVLIEEKNSNKRWRLDHLLEETFGQEKAKKLLFLPEKELLKILNKELKNFQNQQVEWTKIREFNLLFETFLGTEKEKKNPVFLRPETAQGVFINFKNIQRSLRLKLPFGVGQIGKAFRNEITTGHFLFRTKEFEQLELEYFCFPSQAPEAFDFWLKLTSEFLKKIGLKTQSLLQREHTKEELSHYSSRTCDFEFHFPFGWSELLGIANRGDFDLTQHQKYSQENLSYLDESGNIVIPHVIETSIGLERLLFAILCDSFLEKNALKENSIVLKLSPLIAPFQIAILPLLKKHVEEAKKLFSYLKENTEFRITFDQNGSIGKRYRRQDSIGTPFCLTIDEESLTQQNCTLRFRDSMLQDEKRINFSDISQKINSLIRSW